MEERIPFAEYVGLFSRLSFGTHLGKGRNSLLLPQELVQHCVHDGPTNIQARVSAINMEDSFMHDASETVAGPSAYCSCRRIIRIDRLASDNPGGSEGSVRGIDEAGCSSGREWGKLKGCNKQIQTGSSTP